MQNNPYHFQFKIIMLGDASVGKSSIVSRFLSNTFDFIHKPTYSIEMCTSNLITLKNGLNVLLQIWDTCGEEKHLSIAKNYFRSAAGCLLIYDITSHSSFLNLQDIWLKQIKEYAPKSMMVLLVGNKVDRVGFRAVTEFTAAQFAEYNDFGFMEVSALSGINIKNAFERLTEVICQHSVLNGGNDSSCVTIFQNISTISVTDSNTSQNLSLHGKDKIKCTKKDDCECVRCIQNKKRNKCCL